MSDLNITTAVDNGDIIIRIPAETAKTLIREEVEFMDYQMTATIEEAVAKLAAALQNADYHYETLETAVQDILDDIADTEGE